MLFQLQPSMWFSDNQEKTDKNLKTKVIFFLWSLPETRQVFFYDLEIIAYVAFRNEP